MPAPTHNRMARRLEMRPAAELEPYEGNARTHSAEQLDQIAASIAEFGFNNPVLIDSKGRVIAGHGRLEAAVTRLGMKEVPVVVLDHLSDRERRAYILADNRIAENAGWDEAVLAEELARLAADDMDIGALGFSDDELADMLGDQLVQVDGYWRARPDSSGGSTPANDNSGTTGYDAYPDGEAGSLASRFGVPPFSVLDARQGYWQDRKKHWIGIGIQSSEGRDENLISYSKVSTLGEKDTSIFDPVLAELAYRWFCPAGGRVLDPFAGGSVRGIVANKTGRRYTGIDLRPEQVEANRLQGADVCIDGHHPEWVTGDSTQLAKLLPGAAWADMVFSCPPYADLEQYSDDPADLSNMDWPAFLETYRAIIQQACDALVADRFAAWVIGEVRGPDGVYRNLVGETVRAFCDAGLSYYNEAILVTAAGSLPLRAGKMFTASRKMGKTHQNILVFVKGDPRAATEACGVCDFADLAPANDNPEPADTDPAAEFGEVF